MCEPVPPPETEAWWTQMTWAWSETDVLWSQKEANQKKEKKRKKIQIQIQIQQAKGHMRVNAVMQRRAQ